MLQSIETVQKKLVQQKREGFLILIVLQSDKKKFTTLLMLVLLFHFYQVIWNNENEFKKVFIHLDDLHVFIEYFGIVRKLVSGSDLKALYFR